MLMTEPSAEMLKNWVEIWKEYKDKIKPCRKSGEEVLKYLEEKYSLFPVEENGGIKISDMVSEEIRNDDFSSWRLPVGKKPDVKAFFVEKKGEGKILYDKQDEMFRGLEILVAVDKLTGFCHVENSSLLYDEIVAFQGLDENEITNYFRVAEYVECCKKFGIEI